MLNIDRKCGKIEKKARMRIDIMNRNAIISLAMLYALWQSKRNDLLDLIRPFILYAVETITKNGDEIDISQICSCMENEFGYKSFQSAVVKRILERETSSTIPKVKRNIKKQNGKYILNGSYSDLAEGFVEKRTICKSHTDAVTSALTTFLNQNQACKRSDYTQEEAEMILLSFFGKQGNSIMLSVDDLRQIPAKNNEIDFFVGKFILEEYDRKSVRMDYLIELVKGYFVTNALYLQAENPDVTRASFKNVTFYLDTRLLLGFLGYKSKQENESVQEMIKSLQQNGAKLACFPYNIDEVNNILEAYKQSITSKSRRPSLHTLEYFDEHGYSSSHVDSAQRFFERYLEESGITCVSPEQIFPAKHMGDISGLLDESRLREIVLSIKSSYNEITLDDDIQAINSVSRIRNGKKFPYVEKCKAVFVTANTILISATKQYLKENVYDWGFPIAISGEDLCVIAWLKDFERNNTLPQMRLLENVLAAISPNSELMEAYFNHVDNLENRGEITANDAALLRVDLFARKELMEQTHGEKENIDSEIVKSICQKMKSDSVAEGIKLGEESAARKYKEELQKQKNIVCKRATEEIDQEFNEKERRGIWRIKLIGASIALLFIFASGYAFCSNANITWYLAVVTVVTTFQGALPFWGKDNFIIRLFKKHLHKKKLSALDQRKKKYLSLLEPESEK